jgi:retron-type reverse transcriptase
VNPKTAGVLRLYALTVTALEDKIVQSAVAEVLNAIYEADFYGFSYGFRPGRSAHKALASLDEALMTQRVGWVLDFDIRTFFDALDHAWLVRMLEHRIGDRRIIRLIKRWLKAGILESGEWRAVETGSPQGSGNGTALRHPIFTQSDHPVLHDAGFEPFVYEPKESTVVDAVTEKLP